MADNKLKMRFDPQTVRHLGLKMYSHLPAALAEIISNSYDAYARRVGLILRSDGKKPSSITITDDGIGLTFDEINEKFLVIGRNRREDEKPSTPPPFDRKPTGKKGLGKLALFGVARTITIETVKDGYLNEFVLDYADLLKTKGAAYSPNTIKVNVKTKKTNGTKVTLTNLKRKSPFDTEGLIDSLSRIFIFDDNFQLAVASPDDKVTVITNERKYATLDKQFSWKVEAFEEVKDGPPVFKGMNGELFTTVKPIPAGSGLRGITLYSRGKLVNAPDYFTKSTSSHFYSYLSGWINVDFIDDMEEDVISTNRQSLVWDLPEISELREFLSTLVSQVAKNWRVERKKLKDAEIMEATGINTSQWIGTLSGDVKEATQSIINTLGGEDALDQFGSVIQSLYKIVPEYAELHWRHLNEGLKGDVEDYYKNGMLGEAADQAVKLYFRRMRNLTNYPDDGASLVGKCYRSKDFTGDKAPKIRLNNLATESEQGIQEGHAFMSRGVYAGFRNPVAHDPIKELVPNVFSGVDCLNILSLVSYLMSNLDKASIDPNVP